MARARARASKPVRVLEALRGGVRLWRVQGTMEVFADIPPMDFYPIGDGRFRQWALGYLWRVLGEPLLLRSDEWRMVEDGLKAHAYGEEVAQYPLSVRVAAKGGEIFWDLGPGRPVVRVYPGGWDLVERLEDLPVRFLRSAYMHPLPLPERVGAEEAFLLRELLPVSDEGGGEESFLLLLGWLLGTLNPEAPYPVLLLRGEKGAGKTSTARILKGLIDPHQVGSMAPSPDLKDLMVAARWSHVLVLDNVSGFTQDKADALCRMATGEALYLRRLYTDYQEEVVTYRRPLVLTSVVDPMSQPDLIDRSLTVELHRLPDTDRKPEVEVYGEMERLKPRIMGALLDMVAYGLTREDRPTFLPRMADFAVFVWRSLGRLGLGDAFLDAYERSRGMMEVTAIYNDLALSALVEFIRQEKAFQGSAQELLERLEEFTGYTKVRPRGWPSSPRALANLLARFRGSLLALNIRVDRTHTRDGNIWTVAFGEPLVPDRNPLPKGEDDLELPLPKRGESVGEVLLRE